MFKYKFLDVRWMGVWCGWGGVHGGMCVVWCGVE